MSDTDGTLSEKSKSRTATAYPIDMAVADYDRTRALIDGTVKPSGIALNVEARYIGDFCNKPVYEDYDVAEMSFSWYVTARARGEPVVALPVFPLRMPVFGYVFVRADSNVYEPKDLIGKRIGTPAYRFTVNLWLRGIFREHYGLAPEQVTWVTCRQVEDAGYRVPPGIKIEWSEGNAEELLERGEVDAIFVPALPAGYGESKPKLRHLFRDAQTEMQRHAQRVGFVPVTHTIVMKQALADNEPWIAENLVRAFCEAQRRSDAFWLADPKHLSMTDAVFYLRQNRAAYGADSWVQGFAPNRHVIETFVRYAHEQGYTDRLLAAEELFPENTLAL